MNERNDETTTRTDEEVTMNATAITATPQRGVPAPGTWPADWQATVRMPTAVAMALQLGLPGVPQPAGVRVPAPVRAAAPATAGSSTVVAERVAPGPRVDVFLHDDGTADVLVDKMTAASGVNVAETYSAIVALVLDTAARAGRPVHMSVVGAEGAHRTLVAPDGSVRELGADVPSDDHGPADGVVPPPGRIPAAAPSLSPRPWTEVGQPWATAQQGAAQPAAVPQASVQPQSVEQPQAVARPQVVGPSLVGQPWPVTSPGLAQPQSALPVAPSPVVPVQPWPGAVAQPSPRQPAESVEPPRRSRMSRRRRELPQAVVAPSVSRPTDQTVAGCDSVPAALAPVPPDPPSEPSLPSGPVPPDPSAPSDPPAPSDDVLGVTDLAPFTGPAHPQQGVRPPEHGLPLRPCPLAPLVVLGAHGGAGESALAALAPGWHAADHAWPMPSGARQPVVLVARTSLTGLTAARAAATQWAAGQVQPLELVGLVLVADAPGRLPKPLRDLAKVVSGGVPRVWHVPWVEAWRTDPPQLSETPREVRRLVRQLDALTQPGATGA